MAFYMKNKSSNAFYSPTLEVAEYTAAVLSAPGEISFVTKNVSLPDSHELLVQIQGVGMCASTIPLWEGREWFNYPLDPGVPGHEGWGEIVAKGDQVVDFEIGDRVAFLAGNSFAELLTIPSEDAVKLPEFLNEVDFPGEAFGCLMNILERADILEGQTVAIIGLGFIGQGLVELMANKGVRVIGISRRASALKFAEKADYTILMDDHEQIIQSITKITNGKGCERVIECTGKQWPLDLAGEIIGEYGKLIIAGYHQDGVRNVNVQQWNWKAIDVINAHERSTIKYKKGIENAIEAISKGTLNPSRLITHHFSSKELDKAFQVLANCPEGYIKGIITFNK
jgi:threonine dehydrogenase-like Zn-dependent dehydrogenase